MFHRMTQKGSITLKGLTKRFGDTVAVDNVSLQIQSGEFFSLLGPSGKNGKTIYAIPLNRLQAVMKEYGRLASDPESVEHKQYK